MIPNFNHDGNKVLDGIEIPLLIGTPDTICTLIEKAASKLESPWVAVETEEYHTGLYVYGYRDPTEEELKFRDRQMEAKRKQAREQLRDLRREYPELFDGKGQPK